MVFQGPTTIVVVRVKVCFSRTWELYILYSYFGEVPRGPQSHSSSSRRTPHPPGGVDRRLVPEGVRGSIMGSVEDPDTAS